MSIVYHCYQHFEQPPYPIHSYYKELKFVDYESHKLDKSMSRWIVYDGHKRSRWNFCLGLSRYTAYMSTVVPKKTSLPSLPFVGLTQSKLHDRSQIWTTHHHEDLYLISQTTYTVNLPKNFVFSINSTNRAWSAVIGSGAKIFPEWGTVGYLSWPICLTYGKNQKGI